MTTDTSSAKKVIKHAGNYRIISVYDRRFLVQRYSPINGRWYTVKILSTEHDAKAHLNSLDI